jgi:predicted dinucleotide-binding enzyme
MRVAIVGTGSVGGALARALRRAGHRITYAVRQPDPARPDEASVADAIGVADATILCVSFDAAADVIAAAGGCAGKILIDATNPLGMDDDGLALTMGFDTSGAEHIAALAPQARVLQGVQPDRL